ncbi:hypothetical protein SMC26_19095 [Actinomadura fulvescens]|uniref:Uncharacterized protein n=1 Tax=Actinomadura fulvescens TaxID=46160 RepID=A0ABN3QH27_9ACTN
MAELVVVPTGRHTHGERRREKVTGPIRRSGCRTHGVWLASTLQTQHMIHVVEVPPGPGGHHHGFEITERG